MGRGFNSNNANLYSHAVPLTGVPITMSCWFKSEADFIDSFIPDFGYSDISTPNRNLISLHNNTNTTNWQPTDTYSLGMLSVYTSPNQGGGSGILVYARSTNNASSGTALYGANFTTKRWFHAAATFTSNSNRSVYLNGTSASNSTTVSPTGISRLCLGRNTPEEHSTFFNFSGVISDACLWNTTLSSQEIIKLAEGINPLLIRPSSLVAYYPLISRSGDFEFSLVDRGPVLSNSGTIVGAGNDFRLYKPYGPQIELTQTTATKSLDLFLQCGETSSCLPYSSGGGFTTGFDIGFLGGLLYGCPPGWHLNLFVAGHNPFPVVPDSGTVNLYTKGHAPSNSGISLFMPGLITPDLGNPYGYMNLYVRAPELSYSSGNMPLYMWATANSGIRTNVDLFLNADASGVKTGSMNLYIHETDGLDSTSYMNLYLKGLGNTDGSITYDNNVSLYLENAYLASSGLVNLYLAGPDGTSGAIPASGSMNLFLNRAFESVADNISLYIPGPSGITQGVDLFLEGQPNAQSGIPLYMYAAQPITGSVELYTSGF